MPLNDVRCIKNRIM